MPTWHAMDATAVLAHLRSDPRTGLTTPDAQRRLQDHGPNALTERGARNPWRILYEQFKATMVLILLVAAVISAVLGDYRDTAAILAIVVLNAVLGFTQEYRAEKAIVALRQLTVPMVRVRRDQRDQTVSAQELVLGDIVLLEAGNLVPADGRILESNSLRVQEAALTGESETVDKTARTLADSDLPLADRRNMAYMGTVVAYGRGVMVVTDTGMRTELGRIATLLQTVELEPTPLQRRLDDVGKILAVVALVLVGVVVALGLLRGESLQTLLLTAVSLAVAAIPEGLPATVTIALALGAQRMLRRAALIRKLPAVETLGAVTVICSDKTGTLTQNRMTVTILDVAGNRMDVSETLHRSAPTIEAHERPARPQALSPAMRVLLAGAALCNDARLEPSDGTSGHYEAIGDPTEGALVVAAARFGLAQAELEATYPRVGEVPFDSGRKRMTTIHRVTAGAPSAILPALEPLQHARDAAPTTAAYVAFTKGATASVLECSSAVWTDEEGATPLTESWQARITSANDALARQGMRVLGVAFRPLAVFEEETAGEHLERDLIFIGLVGMIDPARPEAKDAVRRSRAAGIRTVMITGDHPLTAHAIAQELAIADGGRVLTGHDVAQLPTEALTAQVADVPVYARVAPEHKLAIVRGLQRQGHIVAMTGDGVNDAPALRQADIGVAMGITGTDVAKEAADMVLLDDNFATIVVAVEEGRVIYDNIRKFIRYLMTTNSAEILVVLLAPFAGMPLPLLPLQILWMNLVTDGLPAVALSAEPAERHTMRRPPRSPRESLFAHGMGWQIVGGGFFMAALTLGLGFWAWTAGNPTWQTMVFTSLTLAQMANVLAIRSERESLFRTGLRSNPPLVGAVVLTILLQLAVVYLPFLQTVFNTQALSARELALTVVVGVVVFAAVELEKLVLRQRARRKGEAAR